MGIEVYIILIVIGLGMFLFWKWLFTRLIKNHIKRNIFIWTSTILGTPIVYILIMALVFAIMNYYPSSDFDPVKWNNDKERRYELTEDLIDSKLLIGKSKTEVEHILGKADAIETDVWVYDVGFVPTLANIDPDIIEITFKNDKVINVTQRNT